MTSKTELLSGAAKTWGDNGTWRDNFHKIVTVKCRNEYCETLVQLHNGPAASHGKYCEPCHQEAERLNDRNNYARHRDEINARRRQRYKQRKEAK